MSKASAKKPASNTKLPLPARTKGAGHAASLKRAKPKKGRAPHAEPEQIDIGYFVILQGGVWCGVVNVTSVLSEDYFLFVSSGSAGGIPFTPYVWPSSTNTPVSNTYTRTGAPKSLATIRAELTSLGISRDYIRATCTAARREP